MSFIGFIHFSLVAIFLWSENPLVQIWKRTLRGTFVWRYFGFGSVPWFGRCFNVYSCIDFYSYSCLHPLSNERKSMFKSRDSRAVWTWVCTWKYLKWALHYLHDVIYGKHCGPDWSFRRCFCSRKRCVRLWRYGDVMTFESTQPTPFCLEKSSVRNGQFNVLAAFSVRIGLE